MSSAVKSVDTGDIGSRKSLSWAWSDLVALIVLIGATILATLELWKPGMQNPGDMLMSVYRIFELNEAWLRGVLYPRFGPNLYFGFGAPLFQFYPPLSSYIGIVFYKLGFGFIASAKLVLSVNLLLAGLGIYGYLRWLTGRRIGSVTGAILFMFSAYILVVVYERGAVAESTALAIMPWLFWAMHRQVYRKRFVAVCITAALVALLMLAHNISALFMIPVATLYAVLLALHARQYRSLLWMGSALLLGLALSAFYWAPALAELRYSRAESMMLGNMTIVTNWLGDFSGLVQRSVYATFAGPDRFRFGLLSFVLGVVALVTLPLQNRTLRFNAGLLVIGWIVILFVQLEPARAIWDHVPLVRFVQFPWRLYGPGSLAVALSIGMLLNSERFASWNTWARWLINAVIVVAAILAGTNGLNIEKLPLWISIPEEQINVADMQERGANNFPLFIDYTPASMSVYANVVTLPPEDRPLTAAGVPSAPRIEQMSLVQNGVKVQTTSDAPFILRLHRVYFPGWQATIDGQSVPVNASDQLGLVSIEVPAGTHQIAAQFGQTPLRQAADVVSFLALLGMCVALVWFSPVRRKVFWTIVVLALFAGAVFGVSRVRAMERQPVPYQAVLGDGVQLLAYDLNQQTLKPGDVLKLRLYWYTDRIPADNRQVFVHLVTPDDSGRVAQLDQISEFGHIPITRWEDGQIFVDEHEIQIGEDVPPGTYLVTAGMYHLDPVQNLPVLNGPNTLPGDRMVLAQIEIRNDQ